MPSRPPPPLSLERQLLIPSGGHSIPGVLVLLGGMRGYKGPTQGQAPRYLPTGAAGLTRR